MAQPPGSEFGADFFRYVLGPVGETLTNFAQTALPTPSGLGGMTSPLPQTLPSLGVPGLTTPSYGSFGNPIPGGYVPGAGPDTYRGVPQALRADPSLEPGAKPAQAQSQPQSGSARPAGTDALQYTGSYAPNVQRFSREITQAAADTGVPERVLASIVHIECPNCNPSTIRKDTGAAGIAQVVGGPTDPLANLQAAGRLLREKQKMWGIAPDDWNSTAAAYLGAYDPKRGGVTDARDATGTTGFAYVNLFNQAYGLYPDSLASTAATAPPSAAATATVGASPYPNVSGSVSAARPSQFDPWLTKSEQLAACGPAVAAGLAGKSVRESVDLAAQSGLWTPQTGMAGGSAESALLTKQGVQNTLISGLNVPGARQSIADGKPVIFSMGYVNDARPGHYFLADAYDPKSDRWHVGTSGTDLKSGSDWMTLQQMAQMGPPESMIVVEKRQASATEF